MAIVPTVQIETENGPVIINKADFDPKVHKLAEVAAALEDQAALGDDAGESDEQHQAEAKKPTRKARAKKT